jgi:hypothetical protein
MIINFPETIGALNPEQRLYFYELFAHFLTVFMRGVLFSEGIPDSERVDRAKWLNEIVHRITYKIFVMQKNLFEWTESDIIEMIKMNVEKNPAIEADVNAAIEFCFSYMRDSANDKE